MESESLLNSGLIAFLSAMLAIVTGLYFTKRREWAKEREATEKRFRALEDAQAASNAVTIPMSVAMSKMLVEKMTRDDSLELDGLLVEALADTLDSAGQTRMGRLLHRRSKDFRVTVTEDERGAAKIFEIVLAMGRHETEIVAAGAATTTLKIVPVMQVTERSDLAGAGE